MTRLPPEIERDARRYRHLEAVALIKLCRLETGAVPAWARSGTYPHQKPIDPYSVLSPEEVEMVEREMELRLNKSACAEPKRTAHNGSAPSSECQPTRGRRISYQVLEVAKTEPRRVTYEVLEVAKTEPRRVTYEVLEEPKTEPRRISYQVLEVAKTEPRRISYQVLEEPKTEPRRISYQVLEEAPEPEDG